MLVEETGATMTELLARASATQGRQLFLGSVRVIVFGQEAARAGAEGPLGFFNSNHQISPATLVAVAEGEAGELIRAGEKDPALSAEGLADVLESAGKAGFSPPSRLKDLMGAANAENAAGAVTLLRYSAPDPPKSGSPSSEASSEESGTGSEARQAAEKTPEKKLSLGGAAVFVGHRMEASISPAAACGLEWTQNRAKACVLSVGDGQLGEVAAVTHRQKAKITVEMSGRSPSSTSGWRCAAPRWRAAFSRAASTTGRAGTPPPCRRSKFARRSRRWWRPPCAGDTICSGSPA